MTGKKFDPWIGVDFDGTLAMHKSGEHDPEKLGEPIKPMLDRVRKWLDKGKRVKIFTARADDEKGVNAIKKWLKKHDLPDLEITNVKDAGMTELWDDKARQVKKNTGKRVSETIVDRLLSE
jgi:hypothetical protein